MNNLKQILESTKDIKAKGIYISLSLNKQSKQNIKEYLLKQNIKESFDDFHCTIIYSKKEFSGNIITDFSPIIVNSTKLGRFINKEKEENVVVLHLEEDKINSLHNFYMKNYDFKYDFDEYKPHMTLSYFGDEIDFSKLEDITFPLEFDSLVIEEINDDYVDEIKKINSF
jgi:2'-5' RNA ligase